jgi:hypothetical protein
LIPAGFNHAAPASGLDNVEDSHPAHHANRLKDLQGSASGIWPEDAMLSHRPWEIDFLNNGRYLRNWTEKTCRTTAKGSRHCPMI